MSITEKNVCFFLKKTQQQILLVEIATAQKSTDNQIHNAQMTYEHKCINSLFIYVFRVNLCMYDGLLMRQWVF